MSGRINLQNLKALKRAPQGTLAFRFYLLIIYMYTPYNKSFGFMDGGQEKSRACLMNDLLSGKRRVKVGE